MPLVTEIRKDIAKRLSALYEEGEARAIANLLVEHICSKSRAEMIAQPDLQLSEQEISALEGFLDKLLSACPLQYVLGEAWFYGLKFIVNESVLIPRPETEELVHWLLADRKHIDKPLRILDIGTGSGCIPIAIKHKRPEMEVWACDISVEALAVAKQNASLNNTDIEFREMDILQGNAGDELPNFDIIISNPPYIAEKEKSNMHNNVLDFEPHLALFVDDKDPLLFYRAIMNFALKKLNTNGCVYLEISESLGKETVQLFKDAGFENMDLKKDINGKERMLKILR